MEYWNASNLISSSVARPDASFNFLYNYNLDHHFPGESLHGLANLAPAAMDNNKMEVMSSYGNNNNMMNSNNRDRKNRLTNEQLEWLERSFQEEIKLDPERKMKLSRELCLQPRQIAVWFQNRRARWKAKQLEHLYESLRRDYDVVSREKQLLQEEVKKLKAILKDRGTSKKQVPAGYADFSPEETAENTPPAAACSSSGGNLQMPNQFQTVQPNCVFNMSDYTSSYWAALPSYH